MNIIGDQGALQEAMARRSGQGGSVMNQQSPASAGYNPSMTPPPAPTGSAMPSMAPQSMPQAPQAGVPISPTQTMGNDDAKLIIKTMSKHLEHLDSQATPMA